MENKKQVVLFGPKEQTDVIWLDRDKNEFYIHRLILQLKSICFQELDFKDPIETNYSYEATFDFLYLCYHNEITTTELGVLIEVFKICQQYDCFVKKCCAKIKLLITAQTELSLLIEIGNLACEFNQYDLFVSVYPSIMKQTSLNKEHFLLLTPNFKDRFLQLEYCKFNPFTFQVVEAFDSENKIYLADVLDEKEDAYYVHYQGWSNRYDAWVNKSLVSTKLTRKIKEKKLGQTELINDQL